MSDMICRKSMTRCLTPGMCSPHGGCQPEDSHMRAIRSLRGDCADLIAERDQLRAEVAGLRTGYEAYERVNAELKAECESLRKDADRFRRMRAMTLAQIEDTQDEFDAEFDRQLDAAMGKGDRP